MLRRSCMRAHRANDRRAAPSEVLAALQSCRQAFVAAAIFSACIGVLGLTGSLYMLQVYDRVLASRSVSTLVVLSLIALGAYLLLGVLDALRGRMLARIGAKFGDQLAGRVFDVVTSLSLRGGNSTLAAQVTRDLDQVQRFLASPGPTAFFDMPFLPIFFVVAYLIHPWFGWLVLLGGAAIVALTVMIEVRTRGPIAAATAVGATRQAIAETSARNVEALKAMGMTRAFADSFVKAHARCTAHGIEASDAASGIGSMAKVFRATLQSGVLGVGAYLAIHGEVSPGAMIAASILSARALAPVEAAVGNWRGFLGARQGYERLGKLLAQTGISPERLALPRPQQRLTVEGLAVVPPGQTHSTVHGASFELHAGQGLAIIGPSASGKSSLARALIGVWPAARGSVRLDGASIADWDGDRLGRHIGYLPQDIELFDGTVTQNICRFDADADAHRIIRAAQDAGAHEMILRLPQGYETRIGERGAALSAGQRQRLALARALYGDPFLVVLDEPNSNLDAEGEDALVNALRSVQERGGIVVVVTHRPTALAGVDLVAVMTDGRLRLFGQKEEVLKRVMGPPKKTEVPQPAPKTA